MRIVIFIIILCAIAVQSVAADEFDATRRVIAEVMNAENLPSVSVAVSRNGKIVWEEAFGWADVARRVPATPNTMYSLASVSKPFTATALMMLAERGSLDLDRPVNDYLGPAKLIAHVGDVRDATVRRVANHTAGLPIHYQFFYEDEGRPVPSREDGIAIHGHLMSAPGDAFVYSNFGYGVLDYVIERVSRQPYGEYLHSAVFAPLGLNRTTLDARSGAGADVAVRYGQNRAALPFYGFDAPGASAVFASAHDLLRFGMLHLGDLHRAAPQAKQILTLDSLRRMHAPADYADKPAGKKSGYGLGWASGPFHGVAAIYHTGGMAGVSTVLRLLPEHDVAIVVLINADSDRMGDIEKSIVHTLLPQTADAEREFKPEAALIGEWRGHVKLSNADLPIALTFVDNGRVYVRIADRPAVEAGAVEIIEHKLWVEYVPERFGLPQFERHPVELQFGLKRRGDVLHGEATTMARPLTDRIGDALSFFVELQRVAPR